MSQEDNFGGGFLLGTLFGGIVGGVVGAVVASRVVQGRPESTGLPLDDSEEGQAGYLRPNDEEMEIARRGLEDKIAQLNMAIDDVRQRLGSVNGHTQMPRDPE